MLRIVGNRPSYYGVGQGVRTTLAPYYANQFQQAQYGGPQYGEAMEMAEAFKRANAQTLVRQGPPTEGRDLVIGLEALAIAAGASADATQRPQVTFRPQRIVIPLAIAPSFIVDDIKVGNKSQLVANGSIPAEAFAQTSFGVEMLMDTCGVSQDLIIEVTNTTGGALTFRAAVYGKAVY